MERTQILKKTLIEKWCNYCRYLHCRVQTKTTQYIKSITKKYKTKDILLPKHGKRSKLIKKNIQR